jgi:predicted Zn-dependent protease
VLGHEIGHTLELHPEAGLVRAMGLSAAAQLIFAGTTGTATNIGLLLTQMRYTRIAEREADAHAVRILKNAGIAAKGFGDFFERIDPKPATPPSDKNATQKTSLGARIFTSEILRTHPLTQERLALARAQPAYPATPALSDDDWRALREMCGAPVILAPRPAPKPRPTTATPAPPAPVPAPASTAKPGEDPDAEIARATDALRVNPNDANWLSRRARAYTKKGQHTEALADYTRASELRPNDSNLQVGRGGAHFSLKQYELALVAYDEAIRLDSSNVFARNGRGNANRALRRYQDALADFEEVVRIRPTFVFGYYNRGLTNVDLNRSEDAKRDFTYTIGIDKDYAGAYAHRGLLYAKEGAREPAIADFRAALAAPVGKYESGPWAHRISREQLMRLGENVP